MGAVRSLPLSLCCAFCELPELPCADLPRPCRPILLGILGSVAGCRRVFRARLLRLAVPRRPAESPAGAEPFEMEDQSTGGKFFSERQISHAAVCHTHLLCAGAAA